MAVIATDANYYTVVDLAKMTAFYSKILGAPTVEMPRLAEWTLADDSAFGIYNAGGKTGGRSGSVMFGVDDLTATAQIAREAGAKVDSDDDLTDTPVCQMMFAYDPEGNQFILHKRKT
ncbi:MAG TPA: VOC family protein [Candidatus Rubrimentiphilum sp.]|nr:VOC family protein [Candidatus Rubrimentiphilum sp.]